MNRTDKIKNIVMHEKFINIKENLKRHEVNGLIIDVLNAFIEKLDLPNITCCEKIDYRKLKTAIIENYEGVKEVDNGGSRSDWNHSDFTNEDLSEIADEIIRDYKQ